MKTMMTLIAIAGLVAVAVPTASAAQCYASSPLTQPVAEKCNYVLGGEAGEDADATVAFAGEAVQFVLDTYGDDLLP